MFLLLFNFSDISEQAFNGDMEFVAAALWSEENLATLYSYF